MNTIEIFLLFSFDEYFRVVFFSSILKNESNNTKIVEESFIAIIQF